MKKIYQTPEMEIKSFMLHSDILVDLKSEGEIDIMPPDELDFNTSRYSLNDSIGFGW